MQYMELIENTKHRHNLIGDEPVVFHCHHFNLYLQQTVLDAENFGDTRSILSKSALGVFYNSLKTLKKIPDSPEERKKLFEEIYKMNGYGLLDLSKVNENGGRVKQKESHFCRGYLLRSPRKASEPQCFFTTGAISAALSFTYDKKPGDYIVKTTKCIATGGDECEYEIELGKNFVEKSFGFRNSKMVEVDFDGKWGNINPYKVYDALSKLKIVGNDKGLIPAFGVLLTNMYANWYNEISFKTAELIKNQTKDNLAQDLFIESGHVCAFNTFGGIMESPEWDAVVKPMIKTREDWIYGIIAVVNCLGWGTWLVEELVPEKYIRVRAYNHYETIGFESKYNQSTDTTCWLFTGAVAGTMNLLYKGDITKKPDLNTEFYVYLFRQGKMFFGKELKCRSQGENYCVVEAEWGERK